MKETPEEFGERLASRAAAEIASTLPIRQTAAALEACLIELVRLLISKKVLDPQEALDAFARASDEIQLVPDSAIGVGTVERLCKAISEIPGAKRQAT